MAEVKNVKPVGSDFGNQENLIRVEYDFAKDGGAIGDLDLLQDADGDVLVELVGISVDTLLEGAGATVAVGVAGGDEYKGATAITGFTAGAFIAAGTPAFTRKVASGANVTMSIATGAVTAGKMTLIFKTMSF